MKVARTFQEAPGIKTIRIKGKMKHNPGQFIQVSVLNIGEASFGVSSCSDAYFDFTVKNVGNVTNALCRLKKGDTIGIRGPYGNGFPMEESEGGNLLVIGGGTGTAPLKSVLEYVGKNRRKYRGVDVFLGFKNPEEVIYKRSVRHWGRTFNVRVSVSEPTATWHEHVGFVTDCMKETGVKSDGYVAFICGPPVMMNAVVGILKSSGYPNESIYLSFERLIKCGVGKCGHCMINDKYVCLDGPVFSYAGARGLED
jgi:sulfite reductase subunit B